MAGTFCRMQEQNPCKKLTLQKPEGTRGVDRPAIRWLDSLEDLKIMGIGNFEMKFAGLGTMEGNSRRGQGS